MTTCLRRLGTLGLALSLAGCVSGPDYHLPASAAAVAPAARGAFVSATTAVSTQADLPDHWWRLYDDPQLEAYVAEALRANTDLRVADANLRRASARVRQSRAYGGVDTATTASATFADVGGYALATTSVPQVYALGITLSYPLDLAGGIRRGIEAASADADAVAAARDHVRTAVAAAVTRAYLGACSANRTLAATQQVLDTQRATLEATTRLAAGGRGTDFDVSRARAAVNRGAAALPRLVADRQAAVFTLGALMGRLPADAPQAAARCTQPPQLRQPIPVGNGWQLIQRRPDIRAAERQLAAATARIGIETADLYPQVSIGASAGTAGTFRRLLSGDSFGATFGPLLSWHWPNRTLAKARIDAAGADADAALASFDGTVLQALRQTESALSSYAREMEREQSLARARDDARRASAQASRLYQSGKIGFLDVLSAQAALADAESALEASRAQSADRQVDLFLALGGGWSAMDDGAGHSR
ncbi:efflux transporter outer membrane subunit [Stenotrophomonas sp. 24(2023)]|uniref:efflux transporter outer membrane subunit n=1 Tax=Stenotrophomonas sp. 24(2023) TaxID=3068324 RepID=UPI0027E03510|nr:efflux transporter outer membrane subunit [Stenotrophomonas sp. 24(2023)]WMJ69424.1 efflux transporter outer membrane subunit [Stenotrophomonas sp. 24(2023)]